MLGARRLHKHGVRFEVCRRLDGFLGDGDGEPEQIETAPTSFFKIDDGNDDDEVNGSIVH